MFLRRHPYLLPWTALLLAIIILGGVGAYQVWTRGLVVTGLSDVVPWGLWITLDLSAIGLGAGAFLLSAAIYLLRLRDFQPLGRVAVLVGLLGYTSAALALLLDLGRPERFWHPIIFWNTHSVLWEITMCVVLYTGVLILEFAPVVGHAPWLENRLPFIARFLQRIHVFSPVLALAGLLLSLLHQSSLGATYGVIPFRPLWGNPGTAVLFLANAVAAGPALTILATLGAEWALGRELVPRHILLRLGRFVGIALVLYLYMRLWDIFAMSYTHLPGRAEGLEMLTKGPMTFPFWVGEILLGGIVPAVLLLIPRLRERPGSLPLATLLVVAGLVVTRWDVNLSSMFIRVAYLPGQSVAPFPAYYPTWVEWATTAAILAYALLAYTWSLHLFPLFAPHPEAEGEKELARRSRLALER